MSPGRQLEALAAVLVDEQADRTAAELLGAGERVRRAIGAPVPPCEAATGERTAAALGDRLGADALRVA